MHALEFPLPRLMTNGPIGSRPHLDGTLWPTLTTSRPGELWLLLAPFRIAEIECVVIPQLALRGPVHIIVGGHTYDVEAILRGLRKLTPEAASLYQHIRQRRAPTMYQMRALLKKTPETNEPLLILNFLNLYFAEDEEFWKSRYMLEETIRDLYRLSRLAPVVVTARPPEKQHPVSNRSFTYLFDQLQDIDARIVEFHPAPIPQQSRLFGECA